MKARIKATGEIVELDPYCEVYEKQKEPFKSKKHKICHLEGIEIFDDPDYWTRLEHQAAIAAMQVMIADPALIDVYSADGKLSFQPFVEATADICYDFAHALAEKLKEKEERK